MSAAVKEILRANRPPGPHGRIDKYLPDLAQDLRRLLDKTQRGWADSSVVWPEQAISELAAVLVEFGEDVHADAGLWRSLEGYNRELFGTTLPLACRLDPAGPLHGFDPQRIQHLVWTLWLELDPERFPSPNHPNLLQLAQVAGLFLAERFTRLPADSGVKAFLVGSSQFGWEIKRKLIWLGTKSYLFRTGFAQYVQRVEHGATVGVTDEFICQQSTRWSGLGAIDILAGALDLSAEERATLRTWYERHTAYYRVLSLQKRGEETECILVHNLVNRQPYTVRMNMPDCPFQPGSVVYGSLLPWRGEWYWSGEQRCIENAPEGEDEWFRQQMLEHHPTIAYRYCPTEARHARESNRRHYGEFVAHFGNDLVVHPDGLTLAAAEQKRMEALWSAADQAEVRRVMQERGLKRPCPPMRFPREFLDHAEGVGVFYNPDEGQEFMTRFHHVLSGLRKRGEGLLTSERDALRHFVTDRAISPAFVHRLVREHGAESLLETFRLRDLPNDRSLAFLLRCHKGHFYRNSYPTLSLVGNART